MGGTRRAQREDWLARLCGESDDLIPYEALAGILQARDHALQTALRSIPLDHIVGSAVLPVEIKGGD